MANYPGANPSFTTKQDGSDYPQASHINTIQDEVVAIGTALRSGLAHALTVNTGGLTVSSGGATVSTGGLRVGGPSTLAALQAGASTVASLQAGASTVASLQVTGNSTFDGNVTISGTLTASGVGARPFVCFTPLSNQPPASSYATFDVRNSHPVLDFSTGVSEAAVFGSALSTSYSSNSGLTVDLWWGATTSTTGDAFWGVAFERMDTSTFDLTADSWGTEVTSTQAVSASTAALRKLSIVCSTAAVDGLTGGDAYRVRVRRISTNASDTMDGDAELVRVVVRET